MANYSELIKRIRKQKKFTIQEVVKEMGVTESYLEEIEHGKVRPTEEQIDLLLYYFDGRIG